MGRWNRGCSVNVLEGKTLTEVNYNDSDEIQFVVSETESYLMYHDQDCCENVSVEDICGDLSDLVNSPILLSEEVSGADDPDDREYSESHTWTFYKLSTIKGSVTIRWLGESNGYYSEGVSFCREQD